jgi:NADH-quinone oxidoreductase subunit E
VATFYFMFQLQPVGSVAHVQVCGTTSCMIMGAEELIGVCKAKIAAKAHQLSADGRFSWEEVECLGACANAPMAQIGKDYYEDLTPARMGEIIDELAAGRVPVPGPQNGRFAAEPKGGLTSLKDRTGEAHNGSVALALAIGDTVRRIDGTEVPLRAPWRDGPAPTPAPARKAAAPKAAPAKPAAAKARRAAEADDLTLLKGVGPKLATLLNSLGVSRFDQIAGWTEADIARIDESLGSFRGRALREGWVEQAKALARKGETDGA